MRLTNTLSSIHIIIIAGLVIKFYFMYDWVIDSYYYSITLNNFHYLFKINIKIFFCEIGIKVGTKKSSVKWYYKMSVDAFLMAAVIRQYEQKFYNFSATIFRFQKKKIM